MGRADRQPRLHLSWPLRLLLGPLHLSPVCQLRGVVSRWQTDRVGQLGQHRTGVAGEMSGTLPIILSYMQADALLAARRAGQPTVEVSPDLGLTTTSASIDTEGVTFPTGERLSWQAIEKIHESQVNCFIVERDAIRSIQ